MKFKSCISVFLFLLSAFELFSVELTKVAIVDLGRVKDAYFRDAAGLKEVAELKSQYDAYLRKVGNTVADLKEKQLRAKMDSNSSLEAQYSAKIAEQEKALREYHSIMTDKIRKIQMANQVNNDFEKRLQRVIQQVAIENGYSLVLEDNVNVLWFDREDVDITDKVIAQLAK